MQTLKHVRKIHSNPFSIFTKTAVSAATSSQATVSTSPSPFSTYPFGQFAKTSNLFKNDRNEVVSLFKDWFLSRKIEFLEQIFDILRTQEGFVLDYSLCKLNLCLTETLVLQVLNYQGKKPDVLSCLKFFDWAGRQKGFHHTQATFSKVFRILANGDFMPVMLEYLDSFMNERSVHKARFHSTLVIGYSVAGKADIALKIFGRMRFQGMDLDGFGYNVLLNALVEDEDDDEVEMIVREIKVRGLENMITHSIVTKNFCRKTEFDKAEEYLRGLSGKGLSGVALAEFVGALCKDKQFGRAAMFVEDIRKSFNIDMGPVYGVWIRYLIKAGKLDGALEFLKDKRIVDGYIPDLFRCNSLVNKLLRENRLEDLFDLLMEMKEQNIFPDEHTLNSTLCFFCKVGRVDVAVELYDSKDEFGMSVSSMTYNYLINTLVGDVSVDEAYRVLATAIEQGYSPGEKTISIIADALCREGKHDKMKNLILIALGSNFKLKDFNYSKFISALCRERRVEDGYVAHTHLDRLNKVTNRMSYFNLVKGFSEATRADIAARLLIEMQEKGHTPNHFLFRAVISCLCSMENSEVKVFKLLKMQLTTREPSTVIFNYFIDEAGKAKKPDISRKVYEIMRRSGIQPDVQSHLLMLNSYLNSGKIAHALMFFRGLPEEIRTSKKMLNSMIVGLCTVKKLDHALEHFWQMRANKMRPRLRCYETLIKSLCEDKKYSEVFSIIDDMASVGLRMPTAIGNILLLTCAYTPKLFDAWVRTRSTENQTPSDYMLGKLIGAYSGRIDVSQDVEDMEELVKQCFIPDLYTYNMLLRKLTRTRIDLADEYVNRIREKGYEPNQWTYDVLIHGYYKHGRDSEANKWRDVMLKKRFGLCESTQSLASHITNRSES